MRLVREFFKVLRNMGISEKDIYKEKGDCFTMVSFGEEGEVGIVYNIVLVFYDDNSQVEIYVRKVINSKNLLEILKKTNDLTAEYAGIAFFFNDGIVSTKSVCYPYGDIKKVFNSFLTKEELKNFS